MSDSGLLYLTDREVRELVSFDEAIDAVRDALVAYDKGRARLFPVVREMLPDSTAVFGVKSGITNAMLTTSTSHWIGAKLAGYWPENRSRGIAPHQATVVLIDPDTGVAALVCEGNFITLIRTAAIGAIALEVLAPADVRVAAVIGAGVQGQGQAGAILRTFPRLESLRFYDPNASAAAAFADAVRAWSPASSTNIQGVESPELAIRGSQVIATCTPAAKLCVADEWVSPGTHISAIGADTKGKQELAVELVARSKVVVDDVDQAVSLGESQHVIAAGLLQRRDLIPLGRAVAGQVRVRTDVDDITIFDATGLALQDIAVAARARANAVVAGLGRLA